MIDPCLFSGLGITEVVSADHARNERDHSALNRRLLLHSIRPVLPACAVWLCFRICLSVSPGTMLRITVLILSKIKTQHGAKGIFVPSFFKLHISGHQSQRAKNIIQLFVDVPDCFRNIHRLIVVVFQHIIQRFLCDHLVICQSGCRTSSHNGSCDLQKGILHKLLVALHALSDLFVKPSHNVSSRAWRRCGLLSACLP